MRAHGTEVLADITVPTPAVAGADDPATPPDQPERVSSLIRGHLRTGGHA